MSERGSGHELASCESHEGGKAEAKEATLAEGVAGLPHAGQTTLVSLPKTLPTPLIRGEGKGITSFNDLHLSSYLNLTFIHF